MRPERGQPGAARSSSRSVSSANGERMELASARTFSPKVARWLVGVGTVSLLLTLLLSVLGRSERPDEVTADSNAFSMSVVGHQALAEVFEAVGIGVTISRHRSAERASEQRALFVLEPEIGEAELERFEAMMRRVRERGVPALVALPKWSVVERAADLGWANRIEPVTRYRHIEVLRAMDSALGTWLADGLDVIEWDDDFARGEVEAIGGGMRFSLKLENQQLVGEHAMLEPILVIDGEEDAILVGRVRGTKVLLLTDPDLLSTMGLGQGDHALLAVALVERVLGVEAVVFDEVSHGFERAKTIWQELFDFPLVLVTFHLAGLLALALWSATSRFGDPERPPPRVPSGKQTLIENTATLLALGHHAGTGVKRYLETAMRQLARAYGLPPELPEDKRLERLAQLARRVDERFDLERIAREVAALRDGRGRREERRAKELAMAVHRLRMEMLHGHRSGQ